MLAAYGLEPLRDASKRHAQIARVLFESDYGKPLPGVVVERLPSGRAHLTVISTTYVGHGNQWDNLEAWGHVARRTLTATLTRAEADRFFRSTDVVYASPVPGRDLDPPPGAGGVVELCLHPRSAWIDITDARGEVSRDRNSCDEDPVWAFAYETATMALAHLPPCDRIAGSAAFYRLQSCFQLSGDRRAAVDIMNTHWDADLHDRFEPGARDAFSNLLAPDVTLSWDGQPTVTGAQPVVEAWAARTNGKIFEQWASSFEGLNSRSVRVAGTLHVYTDGGGDQGDAPLEVSWALDASRRWRIERLNVGPMVISHDQ